MSEDTSKKTPWPLSAGELEDLIRSADAMREILIDVANTELKPSAPDAHAGIQGWSCLFCDFGVCHTTIKEWFAHTELCPVTRARAVVDEERRFHVIPDNARLGYGDQEV